MRLYLISALVILTAILSIKGTFYFTFMGKKRIAVKSVLIQAHSIIPMESIMNRTDVLFTISAILIVIAVVLVELNVMDTPEPIPDKLVVTIETKNAGRSRSDPHRWLLRQCLNHRSLRLLFGKKP